MKAEDGASPFTVDAMVSLVASVESWGIKGSMESVESATRQYRGLCTAMHLGCFGLSTKGASCKIQLPKHTLGMGFKSGIESWKLCD
jgi:hypothetical protein